MNEKQVALRLPKELLDRADALVAKVAQDPELSAWGRVSRAAVLRLALLKGLDQLEDKYARRRRR